LRLLPRSLGLEGLAFTFLLLRPVCPQPWDPKLRLIPGIRRFLIAVTNRGFRSEPLKIRLALRGESSVNSPALVLASSRRRQAAIGQQAAVGAQGKEHFVPMPGDHHVLGSRGAAVFT